MDDLVQSALAEYDRVVAAVSGYRARPGQREMVCSVARAFATADLRTNEQTPSSDAENPVPPPARRIEVISAGTGVGKSLAYVVPGVHIARARGVPLVVSTATTSLQGQLVEKDLPALSAAMERPITFAIAKGRNRYLCLSKAMRFAGDGPTSDLALDHDDDDVTAPSAVAAGRPTKAAPNESRIEFVRVLQDKLDQGWDGDRDTLLDPPPADLWAQISAEQTTCTARGCPQFRDCPYYKARDRLRAVDVIVANHSLVLAAVGTKILPPLDEALWVFDEGHHLPQTAVDQFAAEVDLTALRWIDRLPGTIDKVAAGLDHATTRPPAQPARELKAALSDVGRLLFDLYSSALSKGNTYRFKGNQLPEFALEPLRLANAQATALLSIMDELVTVIRERIRDRPEHKALWSTLFALLGAHVPRLRAVIETTDLLLDEEVTATTARWLSATPSVRGLSIKLHACPVLPGPLLSRELWEATRAAVVTSATLTTCGSFSWFLEEAGLNQDIAVQTRAVASPFDYQRQGEVVVVSTDASPRQRTNFQSEVSARLARDLLSVKAGALCLFTSRQHMLSTYEQLPDELRDRVLVQGSRARGAILALHRSQVEAGNASILFGLQSFGEGLDLPGRLCEYVFIAKLPFSTPTDPVGEARADYVESRGGSAFDEIVVPEAGVRLLQWTGRGIRTESDEATIVIYDRRLTQTQFGKRILGGLPPYPVRQQPSAFAAT